MLIMIFFDMNSGKFINVWVRPEMCLWNLRHVCRVSVEKSFYRQTVIFWWNSLSVGFDWHFRQEINQFHLQHSRYGRNYVLKLVKKATFFKFRKNSCWFTQILQTFFACEWAIFTAVYVHLQAYFEDKSSLCDCPSQGFKKCFIKV